MRRSAIAVTLLSLGLATALLAHDMFLKLSSYFLAENVPVSIPLLNGTFAKSENAIDRNRIADISLVTATGRVRLDTTVMLARGDSTFFATRTGAPGTYVFGVSTRPNSLELSGTEFTQYLKEEGLAQVIADRRQAGASGDSASERYSKHVKAIFQVGASQSSAFAQVLGYPAELIPLENPYSLRPGATLRLRAMVNGAPAPGLTVLAGGRGTGGARIPVQTTKTGADGVVSIRLAVPGVYYAKFISMIRQPDGAIDYESNWATLTFQIR